MKLMTPIAQENIRKIHAAGGVVACGTDQSSGPATQRELELLAAAGIAPLERHPDRDVQQRRLSRQGRPAGLGRRTGKLADLVLLSGGPDAEHRQHEVDRCS